MCEKVDPRPILASIPWFSELEPEHFEKMVEIAKVCDLEPGQELFREGDKEDCLYIVINGRVALEIFIPHRGHVRILTAEPMDVVGWSAVTPVVRTRTAGARAVLPSRLVCLDSAKLRQLCDEDHDLGYVVMRRISNIIASRLLVTRLQLLDMFAAPETEAP